MEIFKLEMLCLNHESHDSKVIFAVCALKDCYLLGTFRAAAELYIVGLPIDYAG